MVRKRAQMEILGIALIVILVSLAIIFVVGINSRQKPSSVADTYRETELSANLLATTLRYTTDCKSLDITHLIIDCAEKDSGRRIVCPTGQDSCAKAEEDIENIMAATIHQWGDRKQYLTVTRGGETLIPTVPPPTPSGCPGAKESKLYPLPSSAGVVLVQFDLCGV